ncbi:MAG: DUF2306 domain-containing protein [Planctomycetaceae bacterium]
MQSDRPEWLSSLLRLLVSVLIVKVTIGIVLNLASYATPQFESGFLNGRGAYFWEGYHLAFYTHIVTGPCSLLLGMVLLSERFRRRFPGWHRKLGRVQVVCVLLLVSPSGLWMSLYAETGAVAGVGFGTLSVVTGMCVLAGWRLAVRRRFAGHRLWMLRCYVLLCSAVVLRLTAGLASISGVEGAWVYQMSAWASWLIPLTVFEVWQTRKRSRAAPATAS